MVHSRGEVSFPCRPFDQPVIERRLSVFIENQPCYDLSSSVRLELAEMHSHCIFFFKLPFKQGYQTHQSIYGGRECMKHHIAEVNTPHFLPLCYHQSGQCAFWSVPHSRSLRMIHGSSGYFLMSHPVFLCV